MYGDDIFIWAVGVPIFLRWLLHVPSGMVSSSGLYYDALRDLKGVYDVEPRASTMVEGQLVVGTAGSILVWWNFANIVISGSAGFLGPAQLIIGLFDLTLAVALVDGLAMQAAMLPATYGGCSDEAVGNSVFFKAAQVALSKQPDTSLSTPQAVCRDMVWNRAFSIAVLSLYCIITISNLYLGLSALGRLIGAQWPDFSGLWPSSLISKARQCAGSAKEFSVHYYHLSIRYGTRARDTLGTWAMLVKSLPSRGAAAAREWRKSRAEAKGKHVLVGKEEEEVGLIAPRYEYDEPKDAPDENARLLAHKEDEAEEAELRLARRWSEETLTSGRSDTRA